MKRKRIRKFGSEEDEGVEKRLPRSIFNFKMSDELFQKIIYKFWSENKSPFSNFQRFGLEALNASPNFNCLSICCLFFCFQFEFSIDLYRRPCSDVFTLEILP